MKADGVHFRIPVCAVNDVIKTLNSETVTDPDDGVAKLKAAPDGDVRMRTAFFGAR